LSLQAAPHVTLLPVSGQRVIVRAPTGADELLLLEAPDDDMRLALELMTQLAGSLDGGNAAIDDEWRHLTATDLDVFILRLRQSTLGDRVIADVRCKAEGCEQRIDVSFGIDDYLDHHLPSRTPLRGRGWIAEPAEEPGWFRLNRRPADDQGEVRFRLPTVADLMLVTGSAEAPDELARRCIRPATLTARQRRGAEAAMEAIAPCLSQSLQGECPDCGAQMTVFFDPRRYCLRELRDRAGFLYQDVDILARRYHWAESDILALPHLRRTGYAEAARREASRSP
jgi:hypothetical protein